MTQSDLQKKHAELRALGINLRLFCAEKNINYQAARDLLRGRAKGHRGQAHQAAVALGLKPAPEQLAA